MDLTRRRILACAPAIILTPGVLMPVRKVPAPVERVLTLDDLRRASRNLSAHHVAVQRDAYGTWGVASTRFVVGMVKYHEDWMKSFEGRV